MFFSFHLCAATEDVLTIKEYNERLWGEKNLKYQNFNQAWFSFLKRKTHQVPIELSPSWARKSTEEYLKTTGGLKKRFAEASQKNTYGFTFKRPDDDPLRTASYHRTYRSIFIEVEKTSANAWLLRFVHEVAHSLDSELYDSLDIYNNENFVKTLIQLGDRNASLSELSPFVRTQLDQWLLAGLNRGFLSEYRAWLTTLLIYEEGLADQSFTEDDWLENIKRIRPDNVSMQDHLFRFLSPSWSDPREGIFSFPFIQEALTELRQKLDANPSLVKLGDLGELLRK